MKFTSTDEVTLHGVSIGNKLTFKNHIDESCRKASYKLHALRLIRPFWSKEKARLLANAFINCQFLYAPLIWMFASKIQLTKSAKFISGHSKLFIMFMTNCTRSYLLSVISAHWKHLRILAIEVHKSLMKTNSDFM